MILISIILLPILLPYLIYTCISSLLTGRIDSNYSTNDERVRRYQRIRNDIVKIIRTTDLDKDSIKNLLEDLNNVDKIIENTASEKRLIECLGDRIILSNSKITNFIKLEELLEDMSENNLYVASNKLRTLK